MKADSRIPLFLLILLAAACAAAEIPDPDRVRIEPVEAQGRVSGPIQIEAGTELALRLVRLEEGPGLTSVIDAPATWSVAPERGAQIDEQTGVLTVDADVPSGATYTVTAALGGSQMFERDVTAYSLSENPLVGEWMEIFQIRCESGEQVEPQTPMRELIFFADGSMRATWRPFEVYIDYVGEYSLGEGGELEIMPEVLNYLPDDVDGSGTATVDPAGRLVLNDIWLGRPQGESGAANCGHIFVRN